MILFNFLCDSNVFVCSKAYKFPLPFLLLIAGNTKFLTSPELFSNFTLATIGRHGAIEHDASLFHYDFYTKKDPALVNPEQVKQLIKLSDDGKTIGLDEIIEFRTLRTQHSIDTNPDFLINSSQGKGFSLEANILLNVLGSGNKISIAHLKSFIIDEKFPSGLLDYY